MNHSYKKSTKGILIENDKKQWSPLYDNSFSLCAYVSEENIESYFGKDKNRWKSLVDTKSKSLLRRTEFDEKRPTHLEMLEYLIEKRQMMKTIYLGEEE